jgi:hypothetical protein
LQGRWSHDRQRPYGPVVAEGFTLAAKGLGLKPRQPELQALRGCLYSLQADTTKDMATRRNLLELGRADLETALIQNRFLSKEFEPELRKIKEILAKHDVQIAQNG